MKKIVYIGFIVVVLMTLVLGGCRNAVSISRPSTNAKPYAVVTDDLRRTITLYQKPKRVVVLTASLLTFCDVFQAPVVGRTTIRSTQVKVPRAYQQAVELGPVYQISMEKVISLQPDLIILSSRTQKKLIRPYEEKGIPVIALQGKTLQDEKNALQVLGMVFGQSQQATQICKQLDDDVAKIRMKIPKKKKKIAILHVTPSAVTVELPQSIAGNMAELLYAENVAVQHGKKRGDVEKVPYSLEVLLEEDPDVILFTPMGSPEKIEKRLQQELKGKAAWNHLRAVQRNKVYVLPEQYFLVSPGLAYGKAMAYMASLIYGVKQDEFYQ